MNYHVNAEELNVKRQVIYLKQLELQQGALIEAEIKVESVTIQRNFYSGWDSVK